MIASRKLERNTTLRTAGTRSSTSQVAVAAARAGRIWPLFYRHQLILCSSILLLLVFEPEVVSLTLGEVGGICNRNLATGIPTHNSPLLRCISGATSTNIRPHFRNRVPSLSPRSLNQYKENLTKVRVSDIAVDEYFEDSKKNENNAVRKKANEKSTDENKSDGIASYAKLIVFVSTTIIIWLSEPMLSLVDTTVVGKFASALETAKGASSGVSQQILQLAALGPATMVCDNAFYLVYFLAIAVTNQLASASGNKDSSSIFVKTTSHALGVAAILGGLISLIIFGFGDGVIKFIIGEGGAVVNGVDMTSSLISSAWDYTKIRGLLAPLTVMGMIAQAVCLATLDTRTPALAVLAASLINVFGDILLVAKYKMGLIGAALATAAAGVGSSFILLAKTKEKVRNWKANVSSSVLDDENQNVKKSLPLFISLPDPKSLVSLIKLAGPIFFVLVGKIICYSSMTLRASDFEMMSLATHNIMLRVFFFFCTFGDSFSLAAQSFLPQVLYARSEKMNLSQHAEMDGNSDTSNVNDSSDSNVMITPSRKHKLRAKKLLKKIMVLASAMAISNSILAKSILQHGGRFFTNDPTILSLLSSPGSVFYMMAAVFLHPLIMTLEGSILATRDLGFLVTAYGGTMAILLSLLRFGTSSFTGVWGALFMFQFIRFSVFGWRVFQKTRVEEDS